MVIANTFEVSTSWNQQGRSIQMNIKSLWVFANYDWQHTWAFSDVENDLLNTTDALRTHSDWVHINWVGLLWFLPFLFDKITECMSYARNKEQISKREKRASTCLSFNETFGFSLLAQECLDNHFPFRDPKQNKTLWQPSLLMFHSLQINFWRNGTMSCDWQVRRAVQSEGDGHLAQMCRHKQCND